MNKQPRLKLIEYAFYLIVLLLVVVLVTTGNTDSKQRTRIKAQEIKIASLTQENKQLKKESARPVSSPRASKKPSLSPSKAPRAIYVVQPTTNLQKLAKDVMEEYFPEWNWPYMDQLIMRESGYVNQWNRSGSGACGYAQFLPCNKYGTGLMIEKPASTQFHAMMYYVKNKYGTPYNALLFHNRFNYY